MAENFHERYERIFGPLPPLDGLPDNASPLGTDAEKAAWAAMSEDQRNAVNSVFANIGKAIAAFERSLTPPETRFDRFAKALAAGTQPAEADDLTGEERAGLKLFIGKAQVLALPQRPALHRRPFPQYRRAFGARPARGSRPRDRCREGCGRSVQLPRHVPRRQRCGLRRAALHGQGQARSFARAYKTPSLRGVAGRPPYMHAGQIATLEEVIDHDARAPASEDGHSELNPLTLSERERKELVAFLKTLDPPPAK